MPGARPMWVPGTPRPRRSCWVSSSPGDGQPRALRRRRRLCQISTCSNIASTCSDRRQPSRGLGGRSGSPPRPAGCQSRSPSRGRWWTQRGGGRGVSDQPAASSVEHHRARHRALSGRVLGGVGDLRQPVRPGTGRSPLNEVFAHELEPTLAGHHRDGSEPPLGARPSRQLAGPPVHGQRGLHLADPPLRRGHLRLLGAPQPSCSPRSMRSRRHQVYIDLAPIPGCHAMSDDHACRSTALRRSRGQDSSCSAPREPGRTRADSSRGDANLSGQGLQVGLIRRRDSEAVAPCRSPRPPRWSPRPRRCGRWRGTATPSGSSRP